MDEICCFPIKICEDFIKNYGIPKISLRILESSTRIIVLLTRFARFMVFLDFFLEARLRSQEVTANCCFPIKICKNHRFLFFLFWKTGKFKFWNNLRQFLRNSILFDEIDCFPIKICKILDFLFLCPEKQENSNFGIILGIP